MYDTEKIREIVQKEMSKQRFGVFITIRNEAPHSTLVCYATSDDLTRIFFFTPKNSRKFINSRIFENVSFFVNSATDSPEDITNAVTISANGRTEIGSNLEPSKLDELKQLFLKKNPFMSDFVNSSSTDMVIIKVERYEIVRSFQTVVNWLPELKTEQDLDVRQIMGKSVVDGVSRGKIRIIEKKEDLQNIEEGEILVLKDKEDLLIPDTVIVIGIVDERKKPSKTITDYAKKKKIPYVINLENVVDFLSAGDSITIDGYLGFITIHKIK